MFLKLIGVFSVLSVFGVLVIFSVFGVLVVLGCSVRLLLRYCLTTVKKICGPTKFAINRGGFCFPFKHNIDDTEEIF